MICGRCGKSVQERIIEGGWHELYGCDCPRRAYVIDPYDKCKTIRRDAPPEVHPEDRHPDLGEPQWAPREPEEKTR